jgi:hypothetical protein
MYPKFTISQQKTSADVFEGDVYRCDVFSETIADNGQLRYYIKTKGTPITMAFEAEVSGLARIAITEAASAELAGTNATLFNMNRASSKTSVISVTHAGSTSQGTVIYQDVIGHAVQGVGVGGGAAHTNEIILANSQFYNIAVTNLSGGAASGMLALIFTDVT